MSKLNVLGVLSGIGSTLIGAKQHNIIGNIEYRDYCQTGTFEFNFPNSFMIKSLEDLNDAHLEKCLTIDLIIGHPSCGNFSNLHINKNNAIDAKDKGDIPEFIKSIQLFQPKFFVMDNLPKSLLVADWKYYADELPDYDIHFEWVNNYGYGNIQKGRKRLFIIGSRKELGFYFIPSEFTHNKTVRQLFTEISPDAENNQQYPLDKILPSWAKYNFDRSYLDKSVEENKMTLNEFQQYIKDVPSKVCFPRINKSGEEKRRIGFFKINLDGPSRVLAGSAGYDSQFREDNLFPLTIRERAKLQGVPDDFVFIPKEDFFNKKEYNFLLKQTGKCIPVEFTTFLIQQISDFLNGVRQESNYTKVRLIDSDPLIDNNKSMYCQVIGYSNQLKVCEFCNNKSCCKYK